jgi:hypothetical protein
MDEKEYWHLITMYIATMLSIDYRMIVSYLDNAVVFAGQISSVLVLLLL